ncbi:MAG: hypothetical protein RQ745_01745 [Longimicrobiales bacterium]|nr:hypothetical protein [Longimicrobiales bacterium]
MMLRSRQRNGIPRYLVPIAAAVLVGVAACDDENLFQGPVGGGADSGRPPSVSIVTPASDAAAKPLGDSLLVRAEVSDDAGIDSVRFFGATLRGDPTLGTDTVVQRFTAVKVVLPGTRDTTLTRFIQPTADTVREITEIIVMVWDVEGLSSADTVSLAIGGPDVELLNLVDGQTLQAGLALNLSAIARDPEGVTSVQYTLTGIIDQTLVRAFNPAIDTVQVDTAVALPPGVTGALSVSVSAVNTDGVSGLDGPIQLNVVTSTAGDTTPPTVSVEATALPALELTDSIFVTVSGSDDTQGSGVETANVTVRAISLARGDTVTVTDQVTFAPPRTGSVVQAFTFPVLNVDELALPDTIRYEVSATLVDGAGNTSLPATTDLTRPHVAGRTVILPGGGAGLILDAVVDTARRNLFLSNPDRGRVEVFRLDTEVFGTSISAGSRPVGMDISRDGDSLWVANGGGTNFSVIDLTTQPEREVDNDRFFTPDVSLFEVELREGDAVDEFVVEVLPSGDPGFTDRGQFMAVDAFGNIIYSTETTLLGDFGTARKAFQPAGQPNSEVKLFVEHGVNPPADNFWALAHIDSIRNDTNGTGDPVLRFFDHFPGDESMPITADIVLGTADDPSVAAADLRSQGSDVFITPAARWNIESLGFSDTTFIARSGDREFVLIGEGGVGPVARVLMYSARPDEVVSLTGQIPVNDFLQNTSIPIRGIGVNFDGTLSVARADAAYFFDQRLRLNGLVPIENPGAGRGAALHPLHANAPGLVNPGGAYVPDTHLAFVGSGDRTIEIMDTQKFERIGTVTIRDVVTGPLKAILPLPGDNAGLTCATIPIVDRTGAFIGDAVQIYQGGAFETPIPPDGITEDACVVVRVFATTSAGGVVVVPVRKGEILRDHPARQ